MGLFRRRKPQETKTGLLARGLRKTRAVLTADLSDLIAGRKHIDDSILDELETRLLMADVGIESTDVILDKLRKQIEHGEVQSLENILSALRQNLIAQLDSNASIVPNQTPHTVLVVGVNGSGKTTTIGKLAKRYQNSGYSVMLAAGDTFRAAAVEQLSNWGERNSVPVIAQGSGADSAAVIFDALQSAQAKKIDILLADTAGRLHTQTNLMEELKKVKRVLGKIDADAPQETLLVLDAGIGQNALQQATQFNEAIGVTGLVMTKLDGTAKGGIVFAIQQALNIPVRYIGVGESVDDLYEFNPDEFVDALLMGN